MIKCEHPNAIFKNKKNKWEFLTHKKYINGTYTNGIVIEIPCGYCKSCLQNKALQVKNYLLLEQMNAKTSYFITLTYDNKHLGDKSAHIEELRQFTKNIRNYYKNNYGITNLRYLGVSEYGDKTLRKHYHIVFFNLPLHFNEFTQATKTPNKDHSDDINNKWINEKYFTNKTIRKIWNKGQITISGLNETRINYIVSYLYKSLNELTKGKIKELNKLGIEPPKMIHSTNLGKETILKNKDKFEKNNLIYCNGKTIHANKYIDQKAGIYTEERANKRLYARLNKIGTHKTTSNISNRKGCL